MKKWNKKRWIKSYAQEIPHWARTLAPSKLAMIFLRAVKKNKLTDGEVLEIGCGNGRDSIFFAQNSLRAVGVDVSEVAVRLAKKNTECLRVKNVKFRVADAEKLPFAAARFFAVYSIAVLHSTNLRKSIGEVVRVLKPGGIAVLHIWQRTVFLKKGKTQEQCSPEKLKMILGKLPVKITRMKSGVAVKEVDCPESSDAHRHYSIFFEIKK